MKGLTKFPLVNIPGTELNKLTRVVEERLDETQKPSDTKKFTTMDLWNIRKQRKTLNARRVILWSI